jgi:nucleotide-binding universal stress UspA family protein
MTAEPDRGQEHRIVVGVDGSASSRAALAWAVRQASLTGAVVEAVIAWQFPYAYGYATAAVPDIDFEELGRRAVTDAISGVSAAEPQVQIRYRVVEDNAAHALLEASAGADLLVVGSRGHGGFVEALLGSVGQHCVQHATCPVVVIRGSASGDR